MAFANLRQTTLDLSGAAGAKTTSHDPVGAARFVVVALVLGPEDRSVSAVSFGAIALAKDADARYGWFGYGDMRAQVWSYLGAVPAGSATFSVTTAGGSTTGGRAVIFTGTADGMLTKADVATSQGLNTTSGKVTLDSGDDPGIGFVATGSNASVSSGLGATVVDATLTADGNSHAAIGHESPFTGTGSRDVGFHGGIVTAGNSVGLMLAETDVVFTPSRSGLEVGVAAGLALVIGADRMLLPSPRLGIIAGVAPGLRLEVEGPRQVMLAGGPETTALTEGGDEGHVLTYHARRKPTWEETASTPPVDRQVFTASGTWTKPSGDYRHARITCIGGGGGGGSGRRGSNGTHRMGGSGGGGGGVTIVEYVFADLASTYAVVVGAGGAGGTGSSTNGVDGNAGVAGGDSYVGASADAAIAAAGGGRGGSGGVEGTIASFTPGGRGTLPGQWGGAGNNSTGLDAGSSIIEQAGSNSSLRISLAGGAGGGGGGGGRASNDNEYGGGDGGNAGQLAARTVPAGGTASGSPGEAGDANMAAPAGPGPGQGGGGGAGCTSNHASGQGGAGGLYGGGGGGSGGQNNGGTTKPGGAGAAGLVIVECR